MILKKFKKIDFRKGAEIIGFLWVLPLLILFVYLFVGALQIGFVSQSMHYAAFRAAREAVVMEDLDSAKEAASSKGLDLMKRMINGLDESSVEVNLSIKDNSDTWEKGNFVDVVVSANIDTYLPTLKGLKSQTVTMMIERPAPEDETSEDEDSDGEGEDIIIVDPDESSEEPDPDPGSGTNTSPSLDPVN